jgi:hypothetical protein
MRALTEALSSQGGLLAESVRPVAEAGTGGLAHAAARGPRAAGRESEYALLLEMILEGSRLHYGAPRAVHAPDPDLALLLGDQLYALGLARLAALGDLAAVSELADIISLVAQAHAAGNPQLAEVTWQAGASAIGWGVGQGYQEAKALASRNDPGAEQALREVTRPALLAEAAS